jgi:DNA replication ATP-dependent helicase Dna2
VLKSVMANNYHMVLGTPGSGKTTAIVVLLQILAQMKRRVLLVSFTNSALDNVLKKLKQAGTQFVRIATNINQVDLSLREHTATRDSFTSMDQLRSMLNQNYIYATTCLQMNNSLLLCLKFEYCVMDEASQINEALAIGPILLADKFVMIGDYY